MAKPNYAFQKRQRELAKKQKKEEKRLRKTEPGSANDEVQAHDEAPAVGPGAPASNEQVPAGATAGGGVERPSNGDGAKT